MTHTRRRYYPNFPEEVLTELNGSRRPEALVRLGKGSRPKRTVRR